jgi:hypothetical protein
MANSIVPVMNINACLCICTTVSAQEVLSIIQDHPLLPCGLSGAEEWAFCAQILSDFFKEVAPAVTFFDKYRLWVKLKSPARL